jgi:hypothetical protein
MDWLWSFIIYGIPWWVQTAIVALFVLAVFALLVRIFGFERVKAWIPAALVALAAIGALSKQRQAGYTDRRAEEEKALDKAEEIVEHEQKDVQRLPDVELDEEVDEWTRK